MALELARAGHRVTALDLDAALLAALRERAPRARRRDGLRRRALASSCAQRDFALCLVPMQTIQLLGGAERADARSCAARARTCARAALLACAIVTELEPFDCAAGGIGAVARDARASTASLYVSRADARALRGRTRR